MALIVTWSSKNSDNNEETSNIGNNVNTGSNGLNFGKQGSNNQGGGSSNTETENNPTNNLGSELDQPNNSDLSEDTYSATGAAVAVETEGSQTAGIDSGRGSERVSDTIASDQSDQKVSREETTAAAVTTATITINRDFEDSQSFSG